MLNKSWPNEFKRKTLNETSQAHLKQLVFYANEAMILKEKSHTYVHKFI